MLQLNPQEYFPIVRGITDHTDSGTYYVQAVIKNARTGEVIATINLTDNGNRYFSYNWQVPADVSGQGYYIAIVTSVYSDSGYTTKSDNYQDEFDTYLVAARPNAVQLLGGGGGGADVSYKKIRDIIVEEVGKIKIDISKADLEEIFLETEALKTDYKGINSGVKALLQRKQEEVDLTPILKEINALKAKIGAIKMPELDIKPVLSKSDSIAKKMLREMDSLYKDINKKIDSIQKKKKKVIPVIEEKKEESIVENKANDQPIPWYRTKKLPFYRIKSNV